MSTVISTAGGGVASEFVVDVVSGDLLFLRFFPVELSQRSHASQSLRRSWLNCVSFIGPFYDRGMVPVWPDRRYIDCSEASALACASLNIHWRKRCNSGVGVTSCGVTNQ